jgi:hypothetical protein
MHFYFLEREKMNFGKIYSWAILPIPEKNQTLLLKAPQDLDIPANTIYQIDLGLMLFRLPLNTILKLKSLQEFKILIKFWLPSCNALNVSVITPHPLHINKEEPLCHLQLIPIAALLPGNKNDYRSNSADLILYH